MNDIPDDVWACGYHAHFERGGQPCDLYFAFLLRGTFGTMYQKLTEIIEHDCPRLGADGPINVVAFHSKESGAGALGSISNMPVVTWPE